MSDGNHATSTALSDVVMSGRKQAAPANRVDGAGTRVSGDMSAAQRRSVTCGDFGACDAGSRLTRATRRSNGSRPQPVSGRSTLHEAIRGEGASHHNGGSRDSLYRIVVVYRVT